MHGVPALLRKTLTYDRGKEMAEHARLAKRLAIQIFFLPIRTAPGNVAPTRTRMDCCANTCPRVPTCRATRSASSMPSPIASTRVPANASTLPRPWKFLRTCALMHPLHVELETAV